jgi:hypothetical protein
MYYNLNRFFELVEYSDSFKSKNKSIYNEDKIAFWELLKYEIVISNNIFWQKRFEFITEMHDFINGDINGEEFGNQIWATRNYTMSIIEEFKKDFEKLKNLELDPRADEFSNIIENLCSDADIFEPTDDENNPLNEKWLKDSVKDAILKIQRFIKL